MTAFTPIIVRVGNAGAMTGPGNNTYLIAGRDRLTLVDAGLGDHEHLDAIGRHADQLDLPLTAVLVTHAHADHASGAPSLARRFGASCAKYPWPVEDAAYDVAWLGLDDGTRVDTGCGEMIAVHTPGHSPDHLVFWHPASRTAFTGDLVNPAGSVSIPWSRGGDMAAYLRSLARVEALDPARLLPAHGPAILEPGPHLRAAIAHRLRREEQVLEALDLGHATVTAIADSIYDGLDQQLMAAARENVRAHLEKLTADGAVSGERGIWKRRSTSST